MERQGKKGKAVDRRNANRGKGSRKQNRVTDERKKHTEKKKKEGRTKGGLKQKRKQITGGQKGTENSVAAF